MPKLESVSLDLTKHNLQKLKKGETTQLKPSQLSGTGMTIHVSPAKARKLRTRSKNSKGIRLKLSTEEIEKINGEGVKEDVAKIVEKVKRTYTKKVKPVVAPVLKKSVSSAIKAGLPALAVAVGQPELAVPAGILANAIADKASDKFGQVTHAYGVRGRKRLKSDYSQFQGIDHPAMSPALPLQDFSRPLTHVAGQGLVVKTGHRPKGTLADFVGHPKLSISSGGAMKLHPALAPVLPPQDFSRPNYQTGTDKRVISKSGSFKPSGYGV